MDTILTRCPACQTAFQVKEQVLTRASGKVRCGACLQVFNAIEHEVIPQTINPPLTSSSSGLSNPGLNASQALSQAREQSLQNTNNFDQAQLDLHTGQLKPISDPRLLDSYGIFSLDEEQEPAPEQPSMSLFFGIAENTEEPLSEPKQDAELDWFESQQQDQQQEEPSSEQSKPEPQPELDWFEPLEQEQPSSELAEQPNQPDTIPESTDALDNTDSLRNGDTDSDPEDDEETPWWEQEFIFSDEEPDLPIKGQAKKAINQVDEQESAQPSHQPETELDFNLSDLTQEDSSSEPDDASHDLFFTQDPQEEPNHDLTLEISETESSEAELDFFSLPEDHSLENSPDQEPNDQTDPDSWDHELLWSESESPADEAEQEAQLNNVSQSDQRHEWTNSDTTDETILTVEPAEDLLLQQAYQEQQKLERPFQQASSHLQGDAIILPNIKDEELLTEHRPKTNWLWTLGSVLLLCLLVGQYLWIDRERWQHQPLLAGYYQLLCQWTDCPVELVSQPERIRTLRLDARPDPTDAGQIEITALIINQGSEPQPWPVVQVSFFDLQGRLVNMNMVRPEDYLDIASSSLTANEPVQIFFRVENPGPNADARLSFIRP